MSLSLFPGGRRQLVSTKWSIINERPPFIIAKHTPPCFLFFFSKKGTKGKKTPFTARLEACTRQKTAKIAAKFTVHSTYTSIDVYRRDLFRSVSSILIYIPIRNIYVYMYSDQEYRKHTYTPPPKRTLSYECALNKPHTHTYTHPQTHTHKSCARECW